MDVDFLRCYDPGVPVSKACWLMSQSLKIIARAFCPLINGCHLQNQENCRECLAYYRKNQKIGIINK